MALRKLAVLLIRLTVTYLLMLNLLSFAGSILGYFQYFDSDFSQGGAFLPIVFFYLVILLICVLAFIKADIVACWFVKEDSDSNFIINIPPEDAQTIAFACMGILILSEALPLIFAHANTWRFLAEQQALDPIFDARLDKDFWNGVIGTFIKFVFAFFLLVRPKTLAKLLKGINQTNSTSV